MAIKNRFFKTTQGVPYEFALCKDASAPSSNSAATDNSTTFTSVVGGTNATGDFYLIREAPTTGIKTIARNDGTAAAVFRTGAYKSWRHQLAWCVNGSTDKYALTTQFIPEYCAPIQKFAYAAAAAQVATMTSSVIPVGINQELYFKVIELTPGNVPLPIWDFHVMLTAAVSESDAWTTIATKINLQNEGEFFTAVAGSNGITITVDSGQESRTVKLVAVLQPTKADTTDYGVTFTHATTTAGNAGVGVQAQVEDLYTEALVREGIGHFYTNGNANPSEFGIPSTIATLLGGSNTFSIYSISGTKSEASKTPHAVLTNKFYIFVAVVSSEATSFEKLFGGTSYDA